MKPLIWILIINAIILTVLMIATAREVYLLDPNHFPL